MRPYFSILFCGLLYIQTQYYIIPLISSITSLGFKAAKIPFPLETIVSSVANRGHPSRFRWFSLGSLGGQRRYVCCLAPRGLLGLFGFYCNSPVAIWHIDMYDY